MAETTGADWEQIKAAKRHGTQLFGQASDGTGTSGNLPKFNADGSLTDSGIAATAISSRQGFIAYDLAGKPPAGALASSTAGARQLIPIPGNLATFQIPANFTGARGACGTNPTATAVYTFYKNGSSIGTLSISTGGVFTWSTSGSPVSYTPGTDVLAWIPPATPDATLSDVNFSIPISIS